MLGMDEEIINTEVHTAKTNRRISGVVRNSYLPRARKCFGNEADVATFLMPFKINCASALN